MKQSEYEKLHDHHVKAEGLLRHIVSLRHLIQGAEKRLLEGNMSFHLYVRVENPRHGRGRYDHGVNAELPAETLTSAEQRPKSDFLAAEEIKGILHGRERPEQERIIRWVNESLNLAVLPARATAQTPLPVSTTQPPSQSVPPSYRR